MFKQYFLGSAYFTVFALVLSAVIGMFYGGPAMAITFIISAISLGVLETSVSLDNAVVNATVLKTMSAEWRHRFMTWGMVIAVFGMRLIFPLAIVSVAGSVSPFEAVRIAVMEPLKYQELMTSVHMQVMAFGGTFLLMVFSSYFINHEKEVHWIPGLGHLMSAIGKHGTAKLALPLIGLMLFTGMIHNQQTFITCALWGLVTYLLVDGLGELFESPDAAVNVGKTGLAGFMYLEVLDASFSFDGVIAAFSITNNFMIIMLGLSIGAMFVRSLTLLLVDKDALGELKYLEDGAFYGIGWLVVTMFLSIVHIELGEVIVAGGAAGIIAIATIHSLMLNRKTVV